MAADQEKFICQLCKKPLKGDEAIPAGSIRASVAELIARGHPGWMPDGYICRDDLNRYRMEYVQDALEQEKGEYSLLEGTSLPGIPEGDHIPKNLNVEYEKELTFGERLSDRIAGFAGSWWFIAAFTGLIFLWVVLNTYIFVAHAYDPYPYILLNLVLSVLTALQAPVIMMSQNRQEIRDRLHAERDYRVSIHTELEIHRLHQKIDHLLASQGQRLLEIQNIQMDLLRELAEERR